MMVPVFRLLGCSYFEKENSKREVVGEKERERERGKKN
jgi:hypothetical protein